MTSLFHRIWPACALAMSLSGCLHAPADAAGEPQVTTQAGSLHGSQSGAIRAFKGIPYAAAPVGDLRWKAPQAAPRWTGVREAREFGPGCIQPPVPAQSLYNDPPDATSEDCLSLNVWAPQGADKAPVIVWLHGGSLRIGAGSLSMYDGTHYAERGTVFVSVNYRLGALGWMAHEELGEETPSGLSGNYGLLDQIAALEWVRDNIAAFGGDPANVTIMGESAGALSTTYLLVSPKARGLFAKAIVQSTNVRNFPALSVPSYGLPSAEQIGADLLATLGAADIAAARKLDAQKITNLSTLAGFVPQGTIDGTVLTRQLVDSFDAGEQASVPVLVGYNAHEFRPQGSLGNGRAPSLANYDAQIGTIYGDLAPEFLRIYPVSKGVDALFDATSDAIFGWSGERIARSQQALGLDAYLYVFDHCYPSAKARDLCAFHASELPFTFGNMDPDALPATWPVPDGSSDQAVSNAMLDYWTSFAASGHPGGDGLPAWPAYGSQQNFMRFADEPQPGRDMVPGMFELHEEFARRRRALGNSWGGAVDLAAADAGPDK